MPWWAGGIRAQHVLDNDSGIFCNNFVNVDILNLPPTCIFTCLRRALEPYVAIFRKPWRRFSPSWRLLGTSWARLGLAKAS